MSDIVLDTSKVATDSVDYVVTDPSGVTSTSTRTVIIEGAVPPIEAAAASSATPATMASSTVQ